jgi:hypothetical protein
MTSKVTTKKIPNSPIIRINTPKMTSLKPISFKRLQIFSKNMECFFVPLAGTSWSLPKLRMKYWNLSAGGVASNRSILQEEKTPKVWSCANPFRPVTINLSL